jgi:nicotinate-nucleotide pyrophosphorylase
LPVNARVELQLRPVDADGRELYAGAVAARVSGDAAQLSADRRMAVEVLTGDAGLATLELVSAQRVHRVPLEIGVVAHACR